MIRFVLGMGCGNALFFKGFSWFLVVGGENRQKIGCVKMIFKDVRDYAEK